MLFSRLFGGGEPVVTDGDGSVTEMQAGSDGIVSEMHADDKQNTEQVHAFVVSNAKFFSMYVSSSFLSSYLFGLWEEPFLSCFHLQNQTISLIIINNPLITLSSQ